jgi:glycerophosphoryl diester phosphodiesterase
MKNDSIHICAHRGASGTHPENTTLAYEAAAWMGATMLEFDVRCTADGHCVILHDATVDRTTDGTGPVAALSFAEVRALDAGRGQRIPTLAEALAFADRMMLNIHAYPQSDSDRRIIADRLLAAFKSLQLHDRAFVTTGDLSLLQDLRQADPAIRLCNLQGARDPNYIEIALAHPCDILQPRNPIVTPELVQAAHRHGLKVNPFYADEPEEMRRLAACGVDGILTNHPLRMAQLNLQRQQP